MMQQGQSIEEFDVKNVMVIGKTGSGKSYLLNLILGEAIPKKGVFTVYDRIQSGTQGCHVEENRFVEILNPNDRIKLNLMDTPGLFDTSDEINRQYNNDTKPQSIINLESIDDNVSNIFQNKLNRGILVLSADQKFDNQHKELIEICQIMIKNQKGFCVALTKCQNLYDSDDQPGEQIKILHQHLNEWQQKLNQFNISEVFFFGKLPLRSYLQKNDEISQFYTEQWLNFFNTLKESNKFEIQKWETLSVETKNKIGRYFNYRIGPTDEEIEAENRRIRQNLQRQQAQIAVLQYQNQSLSREQEERHRRKPCISLDVLIDGLQNKQYKFDQLFYNKIVINGNNKQNICLGLLHLSKIDEQQFYKFTYQNQNGFKFVELTEDHLIYCSNIKSYKRADKVNLNDILLYSSGEGNFIEVQIQQIQLVKKIGFYTPLTNTGEFFGNGILLSCYASVHSLIKSQKQMQFLMKPLILYRQITMKYAQQENNLINFEPLNYLAPYAKGWMIILGLE